MDFQKFIDIVASIRAALILTVRKRKIEILLLISSSENFLEEDDEMYLVDVWQGLKYTVRRTNSRLPGFSKARMRVQAEEKDVLDLSLCNYNPRRNIPGILQSEARS